MNKSIILVDSDAIVALFSEKDASHDKAKIFRQIIKNQENSIAMATSTIAECVTTLRRRHNHPDWAEGFLELIAAEPMILFPVDDTIIFSAAKIYDPYVSKKHTFFDAINVAVAKKERIEMIFSFDDFYRSFGLKLPEDSN
jgi:predicted nucleic acid-binding protein